MNNTEEFQNSCEKLNAIYYQGKEIHNFTSEMSSDNLKQFEISQIKKIAKAFGNNNIMSMPRMEKIVVGMGCNFKKHGAKMAIKYGELLEKITGQKAVLTKAKRSISQFKIRAGMENGAKVTLRGNIMYNFLVKLVYGLLNVGSFAGVHLKSIAQAGGKCQFNMGIKTMDCFYEATGSELYEGCTITIVSKGGSRKKIDKLFFLYLLTSFGLPFREVIDSKLKSEEFDYAKYKGDNK